MPIKSFSAFMAQIPEKYVPEIERAISHAAEVLGNLNATEADSSRASAELDQIPAKLEISASNAWRKELKQEIKKRLREAGWSTREVEELLEPKINKLLGNVEKVRKTIQSNDWSRFWKSAAVKISLASGAAIALIAVISSGIREGQSDRNGIGWLISRMRWERELDDVMNSMRVSSSEFRTIQSIVISEAPRAAEPVPLAVAAIADRPISVTITPDSGSAIRTRSSVGSVYSALPASAQEKVKKAITSRRDWDRTITVKSPVGTFSGTGF